MNGLQQSGTADFRLSLQVRRARDAEGKAAIHGKHGHDSHAAPCIEVGTAQGAEFAKFLAFSDSGHSL